MFDGGAGLAERGVERALAGVQVGAWESLVRDGVDPLDADVAQVGESGMVGEDVLQTALLTFLWVPFMIVRVVVGRGHRG